ncbi:MAG: hypothetical protein MJ123_02650 [Lachnospiraceae bacterium]|nr:hypothetical protein [Lachnospiraceae bacterium]
MASKIEQLIDEIEDYINNCKFQTLSNTRIIVNKDEIDELLRELRMKTPDEIKNYQKIISNRDAILSQAKKQADAMLKEASDQTMQLINEHEIMTQAYAKANEVVTKATLQAQEILDSATIEANSLRANAMQYTDDLLASVESIITRTVETSVANYNELISNLNSCNAVVKGNRTELHPIEDDGLEPISFEAEDEPSDGPQMM